MHEITQAEPLELTYSSEPTYDVIIVGGGLAGLIASILLSGRGLKVLLLEKKRYPFHKVCGEYVSNEVLPFLQSLGFNPFDLGASSINRLRVSTPNGKNVFAKLQMGGFGLSRYSMDKALSEIAEEGGAEILTDSRVSNIEFSTDQFLVETTTGEKFHSKIVIGSYGKRELLDKKLKRDFIQSQTGYLGVKYHIKIDYAVDEIGLDNFQGGYCGISKVEGDKYNLCYLYNRHKGPQYKSIPELEEKVLFKNPILKDIFKRAEFLFMEPEVINEISFAPKKQIENHVIMCGDAAGLITPLCGNGMAMAIHSAKILSELILKCLNTGKVTLEKREKLEADYSRIWGQNFARRLFWGRNLHGLFGRSSLTNIGVPLIHAIPAFEQWLIRQTHGETIK